VVSKPISFTDNNWDILFAKKTIKNLRYYTILQVIHQLCPGMILVASHGSRFQSSPAAIS